MSCKHITVLVAVGGSLTEKRMVAEMATLFFAGSDTTAHTAAWAL